MKVSKFKENSRNMSIFEESFKAEPPSIIIEEVKPSSKPPTHRRIISANKFKGKKKKYSQSDDKHYRTEAVDNSVNMSMEEPPQIYKISQLINENREIFDYKLPLNGEVDHNEVKKIQKVAHKVLTSRIS